jgi:hypothetical protein
MDLRNLTETKGEGFTTGTVNELDNIKRIYSECEKNKVEHKDNEGRKYFTANVRTVAGLTTLFKWADDKGSDWTYSLHRRDEPAVRTDPLLLSRMAVSMTDAPTETEWNLLVDFYLKGGFTHKLRSRLNREMNDPYYFENQVERAVIEIVGRREAQRVQREKSEAEALATKKRLDAKVDGEGMCSAHLTGFVREHEKETFKITFLNPSKGEAKCKQCGTPNAVCILKKIK